MLCYCDRCGSMADWAHPENEKCYCCGNSPLKPIPREYIDNFRWRDGDGKKAFIEEVVKKSPNLDLYLFEHKDEIIRQKNDELKAAMNRGKAILEGKKCVPKCPTCGSTDIRKITMTSKAVNTALFGIFGTKRTKQWHCNNCKSDF